MCNTIMGNKNADKISIRKTEQQYNFEIFIVCTMHFAESLDRYTNQRTRLNFLY